MKVIFNVFTQLISMVATYFTVLIVMIFDAIIFAYPFMFIYNFVISNKFGAPELGYLDFVGLIFLYKLLAVLWKSVHIDQPLANNQTTEDYE